MNGVGLIAALLSVLAGAEPPGPGLSARREVVTLFYLADTLQPLIDRFNADKGKLRFVALLSPT